MLAFGKFNSHGAGFSVVPFVAITGRSTLHLHGSYPGRRAVFFYGFINLYLQFHARIRQLDLRGALLPALICYAHRVGSGRYVLYAIAAGIRLRPIILIGRLSASDAYRQYTVATIARAANRLID